MSSFGWHIYSIDCHLTPLALPDLWSVLIRKCLCFLPSENVLHLIKKNAWGSIKDTQGKRPTFMPCAMDGWVGSSGYAPTKQATKKAWRIQGPDDSDCREPDDTSRRESESGMWIDERVAMSEKWEPKRKMRTKKKIGGKNKPALVTPTAPSVRKARVNKAPT